MLTADGADQLAAVTSTQCLWEGVQEGACIGLCTANQEEDPPAESNDQKGHLLQKVVVKQDVC